MRFKRLTAVVLSLILVFNVIGSQIVNAKTTTKSIELLSESTVNGAKKSEILFETVDNKKLIAEITETDDEYIIISYINGKEKSRTIRDKQSGSMKTIFANGKVEYANVTDYITTTTSKESSISTSATSDRWYYVTRAYNSNPNVQAYGELWAQHDEDSYSETYNIDFGPGTAVSTILGALVGIATGMTPLLAILTALGTSVAGEVIVDAIFGRVYGFFEHYNYEVRSRGFVGLRTERTYVSAKVVNSKNGNIEWVDIRTEGDQRSDENLCIIGAYNVWLWYY